MRLFPLGLLFLLTLAPLQAAAPGSGIVSERKSFAGVEARVVRVDPRKARLRLYWQGPDGKPYITLSALRDELRARHEKFLVATNSGIYSKDFKPLGLHVERGRQLRKLNPSSAPGGNFSMVPNGVFLLTARGARVIDSKEYAGVQAEPVQEATQSGPLLLRNGVIHPKFNADSDNRKLRSGVGVDSQGRAVFAITDGRISFHDFARFYRDELDCRDALYLDGTISGLLEGEEKADLQPAPFVGIWAATAP